MEKKALFFCVKSNVWEQGIFYGIFQMDEGENCRYPVAIIEEGDGLLSEHPIEHVRILKNQGVKG